MLQKAKNLVPFATVVSLLGVALAAGCSGANAPSDYETWDIFTMQGVRVGHGRTAVSHLTESDDQLVRIEGSDHLIVQRFGQRTELDIRVISTATPDGKLVAFETEIQQGSTPVRTVGRVRGKRLQLETTTQGRTETTSIPWKAEYRGPHAAEQSLRRKPMQLGEHRTLRLLIPTLNQVATLEMKAREYEQVQLPSGTVKLLRIDTATHLPDGQTLRTVAFCDPQGETLKTRIKAMDMEKYRSTKAEALTEIDVGDLDLGRDIAVKVDRPLPQPHRTKRVRYRIHLENENPAEVFRSGLSQQIKPLDAHTAELTVHAITPGRPGGNPDPPADPSGDEYLQPNNMIQSDDARITAMAEEAAGDAQAPWEIAVALEAYVDRLIAEKGFSHVFATAAEVAAKPAGDCTEHAVLLTALARARKIPARVAIGLVYMQGSQSFGYHMWTEVFVENRWFPLDGTLAQGGIGAAHLKLAHSSLEGASAYSSFLPIIQVIGQLKIEIIEVE